MLQFKVTPGMVWIAAQNCAASLTVATLNRPLPVQPLLQVTMTVMPAAASVCGAGLPLAHAPPYDSGVPAGGVPCSLVKVMNGWSAAKR